jgi:hypothetical protein
MKYDNYMKAREIETKQPKSFTNWSSPKRNIFAAINDLRKCLASGYRARLIRALNEECEHPIILSKDEKSKDFRDYEFSIGTLRTKQEIRDDQSMSDFEKKLSLEYRSCFGKQEAIDKYYQTGVLSRGNFNGMGKSHLVKVSDMIEFLQRSNDPKDKEYARLWYHFVDETDDRHYQFYDTFRLKNVQQRQVKIFKHKLWVVQMLDKDEPELKLNLITRILLASITALVYPLKYIPRKSVLYMPEYTLYNFRVGNIICGFNVEFQIPKKFKFKD